MCKWIKSGANRIDPCMRDEIEQLHKWGIKTLACCCGHGKYKRTIVTKVNNTNIEYYTGIEIPRKTRFYKRDKEGMFYIPEVESQ
jgi:hypothetical protein